MYMNEKEEGEQLELDFEDGQITEQGEFDFDDNKQEEVDNS